MKVMYFAWLREKTAISSEEVDVAGLATVSDLIDVLRAKGDRHANAFQDISAVKVAVDQKVVDFDAPLAGAKEVAFFPPMTGG